MKTHEIILHDIFNDFSSLLKDREKSFKPSLNSSPNVDADQKESSEKYLVCKTCENKITTIGHKIEIFGSFKHSFLNPAGHVFEIGCFSEAPGCSILGEPTSEWTWFPDYQWQIALCSSCISHLGWYYSAGKKLSFFGLILNTLI